MFKYANVNATNATVIAAVAGKSIRILSIDISAIDDAQTVTIRSNTTVIGLFAFAQYGGIAKHVPEHGVYQTAVGEAFKVESDANCTVQCTYVEV